MKQLVLEGFYAWSRFDTEKQIDFNAYLWVRPEGNILFDPVPMAAEDIRHLEQLGGASLCVSTNADHLRATAELQDRFGFDIICHADECEALGLEVARTVHNGEEIVPGMIAVHMPHGKRPGEIALWFPQRATVLFGDIIKGIPAGALQLLPDERMVDPKLAALALRRLLPLPLRNVLVGDGCSLFGGGRDALVECLESREDIDFCRINLDEMPWSEASHDPRYVHAVKDISRTIGGRQLGYNVRQLPPGAVSGPMHFHRSQEEFFYILDGQCVLERPDKVLSLRQGDFIACLPGARGAHTLKNASNAPCTVLCVSNLLEHDERELVGLVDFRFDLVNP